MTDFPDLKLKAQVSFPARVNGGAGIDITKSNGSYQFDLDYSDFAPPVSGLTDPTHQSALVWNSVTGQYDLVPASILIGTGVLPATATPLMDSGAGAVGVAVKYAREDHIHPTDTSRAPTASPTFTGTVTTQAIVLNRAAASDGLTINSTVNGTAKYGFVETMTATGNLGSGVNYNLINVTSDDAQCGSAGFGNALNVQHSIGGSAMVGGRQAIQASMTMTTPSSASNPNRNYVAGTFIGAATSGDNGTNATTGSLGGMFALNPVAKLHASATNWHNLSGAEVNIGMDSTASARYMLGWSVVGGYVGGQDGAGTAATFGAGFNVSSNSVGTFDAAYAITNINGGWPIKSTGAILDVFTPSLTPTIANGIDLTGVTFSDAAFKSTGFTVSPNGSVTSTLFNFTANTGTTGFPIGTIRNTHNTAGDMALVVAAGPIGSDSSTQLILFNDGALSSPGIAQIARSGTGVVYATSSDRRLKENFRQSSVGLEDLKRIKVQNFSFISAPEHDVNGFVAQDLYEIYPWAVTKGDDVDYKKRPWGVDHGRLTPLLVKAVQDLSDKIDALTARVKQLEDS